MRQLLRSGKPAASAMAVVVSVAMAFSLTLAPGLASAKSTDDILAATKLATEGVPEWAVDDGANAGVGKITTQATLPSKYDLRDEGLVTPVKLQNPWGSCWAFGGTAAAETSILSAYGATADQSKLDLSERHLTYFALQPVTDSVNTEQVGEGMHTLSTDKNAAFDAGGFQIFITSLFSQGVGPVLENMFPYRGKTGLTTLEYFDAHPDEMTRAEIASVAGGEDNVDAWLEAQATAAGKTEDELFAELKTAVRAAYVASPTYSKNDDWSIDEKNASGASNRLLSNGVVLKDGNILPEYWNSGKTAIAADSQTAIKQELVNGHGVSIKFCMDQSGSTYTVKPSGSNKTYNQYTQNAANPNHGVCIVGWDDTYSKSNFTHDATVDSAGAAVAGDAARTLTTPPGDGAWIVKNSWGSETEATTDDLGNTINKGTFGSLDGDDKATGFFYLSYYDKTIAQPETMEFTSNLGTSGSFYTLQHDYMPAYGGFYKTDASTDVQSSANVFDADVDLTLKSVSTRTSDENMRVTFAIYELKDNAANPTDGELVYRTSRNFEYSGFHRLDLEQPISVKAGKSFSVVSTASTLDNNGKRSYNVSASQGVSKATVDEYNSTQNGSIKSYCTAVVNEGESYLYRGSSKTWLDWGEYIASLPKDPQVTAGSSYTDQYPIDNFSIKVYAEAESNPTPVAPVESTDIYRLYSPYTSEHLYTPDAEERDNLVSLGWKDEGLGWKAPKSSDTPVYRVYSTWTGDHHYTTDADERDNLVNLGWKDEGLCWYSADATSGMTDWKAHPLYRMYAPFLTIGQHHYTADADEAEFLSNNNWTAEGVGWYALKVV